MAHVTGTITLVPTSHLSSERVGNHLLSPYAASARADKVNVTSESDITDTDGKETYLENHDTRSLNALPLHDKWKTTDDTLSLAL